MNYQHVYHAGGKLDVIKHLCLISWVSCYLDRYPKIEVIDGFAGSGYYDLHDPKARKTKEAEQGVRQVFRQAERNNHSVTFQRYRSTLSLLNRKPRQSIRYYPGSSFFIAELLRPEDQLQVIESQQPILQKWKNDLKFFRGTAFQSHLKSTCARIEQVLTPRFFEKKRYPLLVFLDPPYEELGEINRWLSLCASTAKQPHVHWALWYPIKGPQAMKPFHRACQAVQSLLPEQHTQEYFFLPPDVENRINGSGWWMNRSPGPTWENELKSTFLNLFS